MKLDKTHTHTHTQNPTFDSPVFGSIKVGCQFKASSPRTKQAFFQTSSKWSPLTWKVSCINTHFGKLDGQPHTSAPLPHICAVSGVCTAVGITLRQWKPASWSVSSFPNKNKLRFLVFLNPLVLNTTSTGSSVPFFTDLWSPKQDCRRIRLARKKLLSPPRLILDFQKSKSCLRQQLVIHISTFTK